MADDDVIDLTNDSDNEEQNAKPGMDDISRTQLHVAIATVPETRLREIVAKLVDTIPAVGNAFLKELVTKRAHTELRAGCSRSPVPRWEICANCEEEYDMSVEREDDECCYHPGQLKVNYESFEDWDEDVHGPEDTPQNRRDFPENFNWTCCGENGMSDGCEVGEHVTGGPRPKKRRF
ncbi:hypothetical protein PLICRDRAFT_158759 [Plicaturopsis crispa FD-325 SS-3]|nr:hypothetical protein PLICRDRAFT_158759 [Plicaturopsis crispa FD-325 SS-3]